jgi:hypothetical protein
LVQVARAVGRQSVAFFHNDAANNEIYTVLLGHLQKRIEVGLIRVHPAVGKQAEKVQAASARTCILHRSKQRGVREEIAILDHQLDACTVHVDDAAGADVEVANFAVAHLSLGQANVGTAGVNQCVGIVAQQAVVGRLAGESDSVGLGFGAVAPAVEDYEDEWFGTDHRS